MTAGDEPAGHARRSALPTNRQLRFIASLLQTKQEVDPLRRLPKITNSEHAGQWIDYLLGLPNKTADPPVGVPRKRTDGQICIADTVSGRRCQAAALLFTAEYGPYCSTHASQEQRIANRERRAVFEHWQQFPNSMGASRPYTVWAQVSECRAAVVQAIDRISALTDDDSGIRDTDRLVDMYAIQIALSEAEAMLEREIHWWDTLPAATKTTGDMNDSAS